MLYEKYAQLCARTPEEDQEWYGQPVGENSRIWISIDRNRNPALFLPAHSQDTRPDIALRAIAVSFAKVCEISTESGEIQSGCYSVVRLLDSDPDIVRLFTRIGEDWFVPRAGNMTSAEIAHAILEISEVFSLVAIDQRDIVGLWGELFTILSSRSISAAVKSWTVPRTAKYDFVCKEFVLDVKATLSTARRHRFSIEQLRPLEEYSAYIVSVCLVQTQGGKTVGQLLDEIVPLIFEVDLRKEFVTQCMVKGGSDIYRSDLRLQPYPESGSLAVYRAAEIPTPVIAADAPIDKVRFDVDLTALSALGDTEKIEILQFGSPDRVVV